MAKCRCNICKSRRNTVQTTEEKESLFHTEVRQYEVSGGAVLPGGLVRVEHLLRDFNEGLHDVGPLDKDRITAYCQNNSYWKQFMAGVYEFPIRDCFFGYLNSVPGYRFRDCYVVPENYVPMGHSEADRVKNFQQSLKRWLRWYSDRRNTLGIKSSINAVVNAVVNAVGTAWVTKDGKFTTRLAAELFKQGVKLSKDQLETIANSLNDYVSRDGKYDFTFDQGFVSGNPEDYCHRDSCWWGGYSSARRMLKVNDGHAVRMWENGKPVARCWIAPAGEGYLLFNAYGKMDLGLFARVLSAKWGLKYGKCELSYPESMYINNGNGFHLHAETPEAFIDIDHWSRTNASPTYTVPSNPCEVCGEEIVGDAPGLCAACRQLDRTIRATEAYEALVAAVTGTSALQPAGAM